MTMEVQKPTVADMMPEPRFIGLPEMPELDIKPKGVTKSRLSLKPTLVRMIVMKKKLEKPRIDDGRWIQHEDCPKKIMVGKVA